MDSSPSILMLHKSGVIFLQKPPRCNARISLEQMNFISLNRPQFIRAFYCRNLGCMDHLIFVRTCSFGEQEI